MLPRRYLSLRDRRVLAAAARAPGRFKEVLGDYRSRGFPFVPQLEPDRPRFDEECRSDRVRATIRVMAADVKATALHLTRREALRRAQADDRAARLRKCLPAAVEALRSAGVRRVVLFGSLASGRFSERSDVDLAVEGLAPEKYFATLADVMAVFGCRVDLVRLEEAPESLMERIAAEGIEL